MKYPIVAFLVALTMPAGGTSEPHERYVIHHDGRALETDMLRDETPDGMFTSIHASAGISELTDVYFSTGLEPKPLPEHFITSDVFEHSDGEYFLRFRGVPVEQNWFGGVYLNASMSELEDDNDYFHRVLEDVSRLSICLSEDVCARLEVSESIRPEVSMPDPG